MRRLFRLLIALALIFILQLLALPCLLTECPDTLQTFNLALRRIADKLILGKKHYTALDFQSTPTAGPLRVSSLNSRYLADKNGKPVFIAGSNYWNLIQDGGRSNPPHAFDFDAFIEFAVAHGFNYLRSHTWEHSQHISNGKAWYIQPTIYARTGSELALDGEAKFDLEHFNPMYFERLRSRAKKAREHGLYIAIDLFQAFSISNGNTMSNQWNSHPFNVNNNINGIDGDPTQQGNGKDIQTLLLPGITSYQRRYVQHVVDVLNDLDNIIWEVAIEPDGTYRRNGQTSYKWMDYFIHFIRAYEAKKPMQHPILYSSLYPGGSNENLFSSDADLIAPNESGGFDHDVPILHGKKVALIDTDHIAWTESDGADWAWKAFTRGAGGFSIMDGGYSDYDDQEGGARYPDAENFRFNLGWIRSFADRATITKMTPRMDTCSTSYCLSYASSEGMQHIVYLPSGRTLKKVLQHFGINLSEYNRLSKTYLPSDSLVSVDLSSSSGVFSVEWLNTETGEVIYGKKIAGGARRQFLAPFPGPAVLYIH